MSGVSKGPYPDPREDLESRSPNLGLGFRVWRKVGPILLRVLYRNPIKGSTFWILPWVWGSYPTPF